MEIIPIKIDILEPPKDDLLTKIKASFFSPRTHDVIAITSKVVSIWQGRCVLQSETADKDMLIRMEADQYLEREEVPGEYVMHTLKNGILIPSAGIDASNANDYYILWPKDPKGVAVALRDWIMESYRVEDCAVVITDSKSTPLRRGVVGFALGWAGFEPLYDYRGMKDLFGRELVVSQTNVVDALAAAATLVMGEGSEQTPLAIIRNAPYMGISRTDGKREFNSFEVPLEEDLFAPFLKSVPWKNHEQ